MRSSYLVTYQGHFYRYPIIVWVIYFIDLTLTYSSETNVCNPNVIIEKALAGLPLLLTVANRKIKTLGQWQHSVLGRWREVPSGYKTLLPTADEHINIENTGMSTHLLTPPPYLYNNFT